MLKMVDGTGIIGVDMICPLGVSTPQPPNYDRVELEGAGMLVLPNSLDAPLERLELGGKTAQVTTTGAQLFEAKNAELNKWVDSTGIIATVGRNCIFRLNVKPNTVYQVNILSASCTFSFSQFSKENVFLERTVFSKGTKSFKCTTTENVDYAYFLIGGTVDNINGIINDVMLYEGEEYKNYEPYTGGKPSPSLEYEQEVKNAGKWNEGTQKYEIDVKVTGRNILSDVGDTYNVFVPCLIKAGAKVTLITNGMESAGGNIKLIRENKEIIWFPFDAGKTKTTKTIPVNIVGFINVLKPKDGLKYCLVIGDTDNYEPYTEQTVQIALDEPLRGIKRITDGKNVQEALNSSGITRRFKEVEITKDTPIVCTLGQYGASEINTVICRYRDTSLKKTGAILCGELKNINNWAKEEESVAMTEQGIDFRLSRERLGLGSDTTPEENKVAVIKYLTEHPLHCVAELNVPTTEHLPESVQQQLQALHSENGTTHVFVDSGEVPCGIKLTYRKEK